MISSKNSQVINGQLYKYITCRKYLSDRNMCLRVISQENLKNVKSFEKKALKDKLIELIKLSGYTLEGCYSKTIQNIDLKF